MDYLEASIRFFDSKLLTCLEKETGKIYISVKSICKAIGMDQEQLKFQIEKFTEESFLKDGKKIFSIKTNIGIDEVQMIETKYLETWINNL